MAEHVKSTDQNPTRVDFKTFVCVKIYLVKSAMGKTDDAKIYRVKPSLRRLPGRWPRIVGGRDAPTCFLAVFPEFLA